jgi:hypothetical protein
MIQGHYGKWIPDQGLDPAVIRALNRAGTPKGFAPAVSDHEIKVCRVA